MKRAWHGNGFRCGVLALMLCSATAQAEYDAWQAQFDDRLRAHAEQFALRGDHRSLLTAVLIHPAEVESAEDSAVLPPQVHDWFIEVAHARHDPEPLAVWMEATSCRLGGTRCDQGAAQERLAAIDPDNAAVWLLRADSAHQAGDLGLRDHYFAQAAKASRYDDYDAALGALLLEGFADVQAPETPPNVAARLAMDMQLGQIEIERMPELAVAAAMISRWVSAVAPSHRFLAQHCRSDTRLLDNPTRREQCLALLDRMVHGSRVAIGRYVALSLGQRLLAGEPEGEAWHQALRQASWQQSHAGEVVHGGDKPPGFLIEYGRKALTDGELDTWETYLTQAGIALQPPPDWPPADSQQYRRLYDNGR